MVEDLETVLDSRNWTTQADLVELKNFEEQLKTVIQETAEVSVEINKHRAMIRSKVQDMKKMRDF